MKWRRIQWSRLAAGLAMLVVASVTGVISYSHIYELTLALHQHEMAARLWAFGIDGLIVAGSVVLLQAVPGQPRWLGWLGVGPGVLLSVFANVESGIRYGLLASAWAGTPAVSFALTTFMLERWLKAQHEARTAAKPVVKQETETIPEAAPSVPEPAAPAAPAGAGPLGLPVPVLGPVTALNGRRPAQAAAPRVVKAPAPREGDTRLPLPFGAELAALLGDPAISANQISRDYAVGRWTANQMKKQFAAGELVPEEVKASAAA